MTDTMCEVGHEVMRFFLKRPRGVMESYGIHESTDCRWLGVFRDADRYRLDPQGSRNPLRPGNLRGHQHHGQKQCIVTSVRGSDACLH